MANLQNLDQRFPIVDPQTGQPTDYFMRLLRNQTGALADASDGLEDDVNTLINRNVDAGFGLSGGGDLSADRTISLGNPALVDPNNDRILFWDDSAGQIQWLAPGTNLTITDTTLDASGGGGSGAEWILLRNWQHSVEGTVTTVEANVTGYSEVLMMFDQVTLSAVGWRTAQVSIDGGVSWFASATDYQNLLAAGTISNEAAIFMHGTSSNLARSGFGVLHNIKAAPHRVISCPQRNPMRFVTNTANDINRVRISGYTAVATPTGANLTGGSVQIYAR